MLFRLDYSIPVENVTSAQQRFAAVNDRQCIISAEIDEADMSKMDEHVARPESVEFDTRAQISVEAFTCDPME